MAANNERSEVRMTPARAFGLAKVFAWLGLIALPLILIGNALALSLPAGGADINTIGMLMASISVLTLIVGMVGTASTVLLGWRADRRQSEEFKLKIEQLEFQLAEAREK